MIFPRKKLILPCHKNGYLQSASDARKYRDRFKRNPLAKVADMFIPKPLRMSPGYPCCCEEPSSHPCDACPDGNAPDQYEIIIDGIANNGCNNCVNFNDTIIVNRVVDYPEDCWWQYAFDCQCPVCFDDKNILNLFLTAGKWAATIEFVFSGRLTWEMDYAETCNLQSAELTCTSSPSICDGSSSTCTITAL